MKKTCLLIACLLTLVSTLQARFEFFIRVSDLENFVECWDSTSCDVGFSSIHLFNFDDPAEEYTVPCVVSLNGDPLAYHFTVDLDSQFHNCEDNLLYQIDRREVLFWCRFSQQSFYVLREDGFTLYGCGNDYPSRVIPSQDTWCFFDNYVDDSLPITYDLVKISPNPFNPVTTISFNLLVPAKVTLNIYDLSGRLVRELLNEQRRAGPHDIGFNADSLPSGTYFCRLQANEQVVSSKLLLLK